MKTLLIFIAILILPVASSVYAQAPAQTVQMINNDFPIRIVLTGSSGHLTGMILEAIVDPARGEVIWGNPEMQANVVEQKLDSDNQQTVSVDTKQHLYPMTARVRDLQDDTRLDTVFFKPGVGEFTLNRIESGIYILDVIVKSNQTQNVGIYEAILYVGDPERDDYKISQLTGGPTERELLRFAQINMSRVLD